MFYFLKSPSIIFRWMVPRFMVISIKSYKTWLFNPFRKSTPVSLISYIHNLSFVAIFSNHLIICTRNPWGPSMRYIAFNVWPFDVVGSNHFSSSYLFNAGRDHSIAIHYYLQAINTKHFRNGPTISISTGIGQTVDYCYICWHEFFTLSLEKVSTSTAANFPYQGSNEKC